MKVNVYVCVLDLVVGDYWMRRVIVGKEVIPFVTYYRMLFSEDVILLFVQPIRYFICYSWYILCYLFLYSLILASVFIAVTTVLLNIIWYFYPFFRLLLSHHCCVLIPYYC